MENNPLFLFSSAATARHRKVSLPGCRRKQDAAFHTHTIRNASSEAVHPQGRTSLLFPNILTRFAPLHERNNLFCPSLPKAGRKRQNSRAIRPTPFESRNAFSLPPFRFPLFFTSRKRAMHGNGIFIVSLTDDRNRRNDD